MLRLDANAIKVAAIRSHGGIIHEYGKDFDEAVEHGKQVAKENGYMFISSGDEARLISGVGTIGLEIMQQLPDVDVVVSPVGSGTGADAR